MLGKGDYFLGILTLIFIEESSWWLLMMVKEVL